MSKLIKSLALSAIFMVSAGAQAALCADGSDPNMRVDNQCRETPDRWANVLGDDYTGTELTGVRHNILGSTYGWNEPSAIIKDLKIGELQIRVVRIPDTNCDAKYRDHIELSGEINEDTTFIVSEVLDKIEICKNMEIRYATPVYLNSKGGYEQDGYDLGRLFREHQVSTKITGGQRCSSACADAFLGGEFRSMKFDAKVDFHAPYIKNYSGVKCESKSNMTDMKEYYVEMLGKKYGTIIFNRAANKCGPTSFWSVNKSVSDIYGITTK